MDDKQKDKGEFFFENHATRGVGVLVVCAAAAISFLRVSWILIFLSNICKKCYMNEFWRYQILNAFPQLPKRIIMCIIL
jgi:hypothetical protein